MLASILQVLQQHSQSDFWHKGPSLCINCLQQPVLLRCCAHVQLRAVWQQRHAHTNFAFLCQLQRRPLHTAVHVYCCQHAGKILHRHLFLEHLFFQRPFPTNHPGRGSFPRRGSGNRQNLRHNRLFVHHAVLRPLIRHRRGIALGICRLPIHAKPALHVCGRSLVMRRARSEPSHITQPAARLFVL